MTEEFSSYSRAVTIIISAAFAVFFAQETQSQLILGIGALINGGLALVLWIRLRGTQHRFLVGIASVAAITFVTFLINKRYPDSEIRSIAAFVLFFSSVFFVLYAYLRPSGRGDRDPPS